MARTTVASTQTQPSSQSGAADFEPLRTDLASSALLLCFPGTPQGIFRCPASIPPPTTLSPRSRNGPVATSTGAWGSTPPRVAPVFKEPRPSAPVTHNGTAARGGTWTGTSATTAAPTIDGRRSQYRYKNDEGEWSRAGPDQERAEEGDRAPAIASPIAPYCPAILRTTRDLPGTLRGPLAESRDHAYDV